MVHLARRLGGALARRARSSRTALAEGVRDIDARFRAVSLRLAGGRRVAAGAADKNVLMVDDLVPDPLFGAGYPRAFAIVRSLVKAGHRVVFYPMRSTPAEIARMDAAFDGKVTFHQGEGGQGLRRLLWTHGTTFDALFISRPGPMTAFVRMGWRPTGDAPAPLVVYDAEAVLSPREARRRLLFETPWSNEDYDAALVAELGVAGRADVVTAVGQGDASVIESVLDKPVFVLPHPVAVRAGATSFGERRDMLFVGRLTGPPSRFPNVDSVVWFLKEIVPVLDGLIGADYRFHVAGWVDSPEIEALASDRVVLHGVVEDLRPLYDRCRVFVAPTRYAAGIPLKVLEAMGEGIPCVATPLLARQLAASDAALPTRQSARAFAERCARLYTDESAWEAARAGGIAHVEQFCSHQAFDRVLHDVLNHVGQARNASTVPFPHRIG